jgi:hypothetical protein
MQNRMEPVIIIGMHRSGTSMLTKFIEESGIFIGKKNKMGPNKEAFFFQRINEWMLFQKGASWDNIDNLKFHSEFTNDNLIKVVKDRLQSIIHTRNYLHFRDIIFKGNLMECDLNWGWKDPKTTILLDVWSKIFPDAKIVHIYRNPIDVACSLLERELLLEKKFYRNWRIRKREFFLTKRPNYNQSVRITNIFEGVKLWEEYIHCSLESENYFKNVIHIGYEDFLFNPDNILSELSSFLKIEIDRNVIESIISKVNPKRAFAFKNNAKLVELYESIKDRELVKKLNYDNLI